MYTNQDASPHDMQSHRVCAHASGAATLDTCHYLRLLRELGAWAARAEAALLAGEPSRAGIGELWLLHGRISYALDHCPGSAIERELAPATAAPASTNH